MSAYSFLASAEGAIGYALVPTGWPCWARRAFLLTLPLSLPLLLTGYALVCVAAVCIVLAILFLHFLTPFVVAVSWCVTAISSLWDADQ